MYRHTTLSGKVLIYNEKTLRWRSAHNFVWTCKGYLRTNRYGDKVIEPNEVVGAMENEMAEILAEGIELLLDRFPFRSHAYYPATQPIPCVCLSPWKWWPRGF